LALESLEDRTVPTVVFNPALGPDQVFWRAGNAGNHPANQVVTGPLQTNADALSNSGVYLIFFGKSWTKSLVQPLVADAQTILASSYLSGLTDYGSSGTATYSGYTIDNSPLPDIGVNHGDMDPADIGQKCETAAAAEIRKIVPQQGWTQPQDNSPVHSPIYCVLFDYGDQGGANWPDQFSQTQTMNVIWIQLGPKQLGGHLRQGYDLTLSHELAERISDGTGNGIGVNGPYDPVTKQYINAGDNENQNVQICDGEPNGEKYIYPLNGSVWVQAYWSLSAQAFIVPDGNSQTLYLDGQWDKSNPDSPTFLGTFDLTVKGDQPGKGSNYNDVISVEQVDSGVQVTINGEVFRFDTSENWPITTYQFWSITIEPGGGNNTVNVKNLGNIPLDLECAAGSNNLVQFGNEDYGPVTIDGHGGNVTLDYAPIRNYSRQDQYETFTVTHALNFAITSQAVTWNDKASWSAYVPNPRVNPNLKNFPPNQNVETFIKDGHLEVYPMAYSGKGTFFATETTTYSDVGQLTINGAPVDTTFNVQSTASGTPLTVNASSQGKQAFTIGNKGSVHGIASRVALLGQVANSTVVVDDSASTSQDRVSISNGLGGDVEVGHAGDQFFGSGGELDCTGMSVLTLNLSKAAGDTVQLAPSMVTAFAINGQVGYPAQLQLDLTGITDALLTPGEWTFTKGSHKAVTFSNMK
jgi:hypothetical protein